MAQININQGTLQGGKCVTGNGCEYFEFFDIPYAQPPVGKLRFQVPQPPENWKGVRDATVADENHINYQMHMFDSKLKGSEDCLYLNVYSPKLPSPGSKLLPVMVHIHGGGFVMGNGTLKADGGPDFLIENEIIVVTINYRLGVFGFLSLDIPEAAGNMGLKDQVMALKWIHENITKFGGDKDNVTLFGISAGGAAIEYLILSPLSEGLFHKAITQSGSSLNTWAFYPNVKELSIKYAQDLGYQGAKNDDRAIYNFLLEQPMEVLGGAAQSELSKLAKRTCFGFGPSIEKDFGNGTAFITRSPKEILKYGKINEVDVLSGFCQYEGIMLGSMKPDILKELSEQKNFADFFTYPFPPSEAETYSLKLKNAYYGDSLNNRDNQLAAIDYYGDVDFAAGVWIRSKWLAERGISVYSYIFTYNSNWNFKGQIFAENKLCRTGACHGDDISYILKVALLDSVPPSPSDFLMIKRLTKMWTDFAKTGNPTPNTSDLTPILWPRFDVNNPKYLKIDKDLEILTDYMPEKMSIFEDLYEKTYV